MKNLCLWAALLASATEFHPVLWTSDLSSQPTQSPIPHTESLNIPYFAMYNAHPRFCAHYTQDYNTHVI